jgi:hypothetical protein
MTDLEEQFIAHAIEESLKEIRKNEIIDEKEYEPDSFIEIDKPISDKPISDKPISDKPISDKPISDKPISDKPISDKPISDKPPDPSPHPPTKGMKLVNVIKNGWLTQEWR